MPERLPVPTGDKGAISPDGKYLAYTPLGEVFRQWKNYRGGTASRIWILKLDDLSHEEIPKPAGGCNDTEPMWIGETVYFLSDRDGEFNLYSYDRGSKTVARCTDHDAFPIASASSGAGKLIYEQAGWIHVFDPHERQSHRLKIGVAADLVETRPRFASDLKHIRGFSDLPRRPSRRAGIPRRDRHGSGQEGRPSQPHPVARRTRSLPRLVARRQVDRLFLRRDAANTSSSSAPRTAREKESPTPLHGSGFYQGPVWSPDSKKIAFIDNSRTLSWIDLASGAVKRVAAEPIYGPRRTSRTNYAWSPDSKWLAYSLTNRAGFQQIWLYSLDGRQVDERHRRPRRSRRAGLRRERQIPLFPGLDRRRPGEQLVRPVQHRHAGDRHDLPGHARQGDGQPAPQGKRRGRAPSREEAPDEEAKD